MNVKEKKAKYYRDNNLTCYAIIGETATHWECECLEGERMGEVFYFPKEKE